MSEGFEGWIKMEVSVKNNHLMTRLQSFMLEIEHQLVVARTRRTVQVSTRKYRARRGRRK